MPRVGSTMPVACTAPLAAVPAVAVTGSVHADRPFIATVVPAIAVVFRKLRLDVGIRFPRASSHFAARYPASRGIDPINWLDTARFRVPASLEALTETNPRRKRPPCANQCHRIRTSCLFLRINPAQRLLLDHKEKRRRRDKCLNEALASCASAKLHSFIETQLHRSPKPTKAPKPIWTSALLCAAGGGNFAAFRLTGCGYRISYARNPRFEAEKLAMLGKMDGRFAALTPNHWARVAPY